MKVVSAKEVARTYTVYCFHAPLVLMFLICIWSSYVPPTVWLMRI